MLIDRPLEIVISTPRASSEVRKPDLYAEFLGRAPKPKRSPPLKRGDAQRLIDLEPSNRELRSRCGGKEPWVQSRGKFEAHGEVCKLYHQSFIGGGGGSRTRVRKCYWSRDYMLIRVHAPGVCRHCWRFPRDVRGPRSERTRNASR